MSVLLRFNEFSCQRQGVSNRLRELLEKHFTKEHLSKSYNDLFVDFNNAVTAEFEFGLKKHRIDIIYSMLPIVREGREEEEELSVTDPAKQFKVKLEFDVIISVPPLVIRTDTYLGELIFENKDC